MFMTMTMTMTKLRGFLSLKFRGSKLQGLHKKYINFYNKSVISIKNSLLIRLRFFYYVLLMRHPFK